MNRFIFNLLVSNILFFSVLEVERAIGKGNCVLKDQQNHTLYDAHWEYGIQLEPVNDFEEPYIMISRLFYKNITEVTKPNWNEQFNYFFAYTDFTVNALVIKTDYEFRKYEEKETSTHNQFTMEFQFRNGKRSEMDTNNHSPEFLNEPYEYTVPMPIPKGYHLDISGRIAVRDIDLTNKYVTFSLDKNTENANAFIISSTGRDADNVKIYPAQFDAATLIDLEDDFTCTLFATVKHNEIL